MMSPGRDELIELGQAPLDELMAGAAALRDAAHGATVTWSPKVFIPLTELCRDVCHYCTYAKTPGRLAAPYMTPEQVLAIARAGQQAGCREALFTLGDKPELRYRVAREALASLGHATTTDYLSAMARLVLEKTGLLPHLNPGVLEEDDYRRLRPLAPSMGLMLESASPRLARRGGPHFGSPDKQPQVRLDSLRAAGKAGVAMTSGLLIGIGETREERIDSLLALRTLHEEYGHLQELILQNFVPKPGTLMAGAPAPAFEELLWTVAIARHAFGGGFSLQAPPNLNAGRLARLVDAGINDWGGVSPVTPDHVNPESPWPHLAELEAATAEAGKTLVPRLTLYPAMVREPDRWIAPELRTHVLRAADSSGFARDCPWSPGSGQPPPPAIPAGPRRDRFIETLLGRIAQGKRPDEADISRLFSARGPDLTHVIRAADEMRAAQAGEQVSYVVNRNINYTNLCSYQCSFCAFSKGRTHEDLRGAPYVLDMEEIGRRSAEAWARGASEVCLQGGIHPSFTGRTYLDILAAVKAAAPGLHVHAFSALEVSHGAKTLGISVAEFLAELRVSGLASLPGTAAEILSDDIRAVICPDKLNTGEWLAVARQAHELGLRTTATIMFGHVEHPVHWARHLLAIRDLQAETGGFTEFVPLPFVHM
ncbi:MAG: 7,8-didemethyl-8-hydroxy-5-deazariboflavin synthase CofG [Chromatiales bacterium]|nr:7,8-didemethyl-8-hydroxy-5-deazariboflavin synthase CofG [Chromatiales bacterium]